ncbi:hypothetical protein QFC22_005634 [Naganishia vaughanmartiniae]|uniref:Uncharacterized protein n=1 Tax=Naganishia vaughanmartiniae TaxID=1424756 RepID=A0ACC2WSM2_9TREE|nr:hypothetical protein QFC22_005634 [Naganishia vaughanmartiniae]
MSGKNIGKPVHRLLRLVEQVKGPSAPSGIDNRYYAFPAAPSGLQYVQADQLFTLVASSNNPFHQPILRTHAHPYILPFLLHTLTSEIQKSPPPIIRNPRLLPRHTLPDNPHPAARIAVHLRPVVHRLVVRGEIEGIGREEARQGYSAAGSPLPGEGTALIRAVARTSTEIMDLSSSPTIFRDPNPDDDDDDYHIISQSPSPSPPPTSTAHNAQTLKLSIISSRGIAISFLSGVTLLSLSLIPILLTHGSLKALRSVIGTSGLVWLSSTGVVWLLLRQRGSFSRVPVTVPEARRRGGGVVDFPGMNGLKDDSWDIVKQKVWEGWARVGMLVNGEEIRRLRVTYWYLLASALLQDGKSALRPCPHIRHEHFRA